MRSTMHKKAKSIFLITRKVFKISRINEVYVFFNKISLYVIEPPPPPPLNFIQSNRLHLLFCWRQHHVIKVVPRCTSEVWFHGIGRVSSDCMGWLSQYVNWNKHPVPIPPSSRLIHYELQHSCVTSCWKSWCESCWYSCNCEGPPIKIHFSINLSNCYSYNHVNMYSCDCQFH